MAGYRNVTNLKGGAVAWARHGLPREIQTATMPQPDHDWTSSVPASAGAEVTRVPHASSFQDAGTYLISWQAGVVLSHTHSGTPEAQNV